MGKLRQEINGNSADQAGSGRTATTWVYDFNKFSRVLFLLAFYVLFCSNLFIIMKKDFILIKKVVKLFNKMSDKSRYVLNILI